MSCRTEGGGEAGPHPDPENLATHALGALPGAEEGRVVRHLARCSRCSAAFAPLARAAGRLSMAAAPRAAPAGLRARVLAAASWGQDSQRGDASAS